MTLQEFCTKHSVKNTEFYDYTIINNSGIVIPRNVLLPSMLISFFSIAIHSHPRHLMVNGSLFDESEQHMNAGTYVEKSLYTVGDVMRCYDSIQVNGYFTENGIIS